MNIEKRIKTPGENSHIKMTGCLSNILKKDPKEYHDSGCGRGLMRNQF